MDIKFDSKARTEADRAKLDFLEDILKTIVEWIVDLIRIKTNIIIALKPKLIT